MRQNEYLWSKGLKISGNSLISMCLSDLKDQKLPAIKTQTD